MPPSVPSSFRIRLEFGGGKAARNDRNGATVLAPC
jgi:hypothetical protein